MRFSFFSLLFLSFILSLNAVAIQPFDIELAVYQGDIQEIKKYKDRSCYGELWFKYISGEMVRSQDCNFCASSPSVAFNCAIFSSNSMAQGMMYKGAQMVLLNFINEPANSELLSESLYDEMSNRAALFAFIDARVRLNKRHFAELIVNKKFRPLDTVWGKESGYTIDTAAGFSSTTSVAIQSEYFNANTISLSGNIQTQTMSLVKLFENESPTYVKSNKNLIGIFDLLQFSSIKISGNEVDRSDFINLYRDQNTFFFNSQSRIQNKKFDNLNLCIDTGSEQSFIMPKLYKRIRDTIQQKPIVVLKASETTGDMNRLGRIVDKIELNINGYDHVIYNIPAMFRSNSANICDVLLGQDFLGEKMSQISLKERWVSFKHL